MKIYEYEKFVQSRSICAENPSGEKGEGGKCLPNDSDFGEAARELGVGWKCSPCYRIGAGKIKILANIQNSGVISHIWMTATEDLRKIILRFYWDNDEIPAVECPMSDFFACSGGYSPINSIWIANNSNKAYNCFFEMPFRKACKITAENKNGKEILLFYQVDYSLRTISESALYFHAQFFRNSCVDYKKTYEILAEVTGKGKYIGTYLYMGVVNNGWWGEGELKIYIDDDKFPTYCGTGTEDYFLGAWNFDLDGQYMNFSHLYSGFVAQPTNQLYNVIKRFSMYRWHAKDPFYFEKNIKIDIQSLGWKSDSRYMPTRNDFSSVAYFYLDRTSATARKLPSSDELEID